MGVFSAHSVRGALTSTALAKGVRLADMLAVADWSRDSTFTTFYYRPSMKDSYAKTILS